MRLLIARILLAQRVLQSPRMSPIPSKGHLHLNGIPTLKITSAILSPSVQVNGGWNACEACRRPVFGARAHFTHHRIEARRQIQEAAVLGQNKQSLTNTHLKSWVHIAEKVAEKEEEIWYPEGDINSSSPSIPIYSAARAARAVLMGPHEVD